jgi:vancomycin permeability regulator SanA
VEGVQLPGKINRVVIRLKRYKWWLAGTAALLAALTMGPTWYANAATQALRYDAAAINEDKLPKRAVAIVFGAGVLPDGEPTPYLKRRLDTAAELFHAGKAQRLLLSGDNSSSHYNEPVAMKRYALSLGVPEDRIVLDYAGFNTYDSCYRAKVIFGVQEATLVTHDYHLPRAILTCKGLGVKSIGVAARNAGKAGRDFSINYVVREFASTDKAALQIMFKPNPTVLGKPELIQP